MTIARTPTTASLSTLRVMLSHLTTATARHRARSLHVPRVKLRTAKGSALRKVGSAMGTVTMVAMPIRRLDCLCILTVRSFNTTQETAERTCYRFLSDLSETLCEGEVAMTCVRVRLEIQRFETLRGYTQELDIPLLSSADARQELLDSLSDVPKDDTSRLRGRIDFEFWSTDEDAYRAFTFCCDGMTLRDAIEQLKRRPLWKLERYEHDVRALRINTPRSQGATFIT